MAIDFSVEWAQEVADVSGLVEYQNAQIEIRDPQLLNRTGNINDGYIYTGDPVVWSGQARVASTRTDVSAGGTTSTNPTSIKAMRVQIPYDKDFQRVKRGWEVRVTDGGRNDRLTEYLFMIESDVNSSQVASLTFNTTVDVESEPQWTEPFFIGGTVSDEDGPLAGVNVRAFFLEEEQWILAMSSITASNGTYRLRGTIPSVSYVINMTKAGYISQVYDNASENDLSLGDPVAYNATGIDAELVAE